MSDKYEEAAREYIARHTHLIATQPPRFKPEFDLADAFRWYDSKREAETCETCGHWLVTHYSDQHGDCKVLDRYTKSTFGCTEYARRIVEKQGGK